MQVHAVTPYVELPSTASNSSAIAIAIEAIEAIEAIASIGASWATLHASTH